MKYFTGVACGLGFLLLSAFLPHAGTQTKQLAEKPTQLSAVKRSLEAIKLKDEAFANELQFRIEGHFKTFEPAETKQLISAMELILRETLDQHFDNRKPSEIRSLATALAKGNTSASVINAVLPKPSLESEED